MSRALGSMIHWSVCRPLMWTCHSQMEWLHLVGYIHLCFSCSGHHRCAVNRPRRSGLKTRDTLDKWPVLWETRLDWLFGVGSWPNRRIFGFREEAAANEMKLLKSRKEPQTTLIQGLNVSTTKLARTLSSGRSQAKKDNTCYQRYNLWYCFFFVLKWKVLCHHFLVLLLSDEWQSLRLCFPPYLHLDSSFVVLSYLIIAV